MKLLFDENLSDRIISRVADLFPDSTHIKAVGLREADDFVVWVWAKKHGFTIVSKDTDFHQRAIVFGQPAEVHMATCGELPDQPDHESFEISSSGYSAVIESETESLLILERPQT